MHECTKTYCIANVNKMHKNARYTDDKYIYVHRVYD